MSVTQQNKSDLILYAALEQFAENGFHSSPVSQLASLAGVGVGSIYRYFKDKDELIHAVFTMVDDALQKAITASMNPELSGRSEFIQLVTSLIQYLDKHPQEFKFLEQYYSSPYGADKKRAKFLCEGRGGSSNPFVDLFFGNKAKSLKDLPLPLYLAMTFGPIIFLLRDSLSGLVTLDEALIQQTAEASWNAIKAEN
ncbi:MAG: TetR/AcrR family transcriptional regulator [Desulfuromusa sp.]|nr:TetR/AcrR family transcriptional regulator [Desulfuromusa sp.]